MRRSLLVESALAEIEISFCAGGVNLRGTLAVPERPPLAGVLLLGGSGRVDRNENTRGFRLNLLADLARQLAEADLASLRYDKRGVGASEGNFWSTGFHENVADAEAALDFLRSCPKLAGCALYVLGHSEGAYIAMRLATRVKGIAGIILLAGGARSVEEELRWQARRVSETLTGPTAWILRLLGADFVKKQAKEIETIKRSRQDTFRRQLLAKVNAKWARELLAYDPQDDLSSLQVPVLALIGTKDIQVDVSNLDRLKEVVRSPLETHALPDVTHLFRVERGAPGLAGYRRQLRQPLAPQVAEVIVSWIRRQLAGWC